MALIKKYNTKGTLKQDLVAAKSELKQFRRDVAQLKKRGLINKKYDARKITPSKYLKSQIKKFAAVLKGEASAVKINIKNKKYYASKGYVVKGTRVVVPHANNERVYTTHGEFRIKTIGTNGSITRIDLRLPQNDVTKWADELQRKKLKLAPNEQITFQLYGNNSYRSFMNFKQMIEYLDFYNAFQWATQSVNPGTQQDFIDNVVIYKIERGGPLPAKPPTPPEVIVRRRRKARERRERYLDRLTPEQENQYFDERADYQRERRAKLKRDTDPTKLLKEREAARLRAKKSYERRKKK